MTGLPLLPWQPEMIAFLKSHPRALCGDEMRLAKTACAIVAAQDYTAHRLVLCPAIAIPHWLASIATWDDDPERWTVRSYDYWRRHADQQTDPGVVILDEAHRLKSSAAKQTRAVYGTRCQGRWLARADAVWALSGTFVPNHAGELWTHFHALFGDPLAEWEWRERYCLGRATPWGWKVYGNNPEHVDELRAKIRAVMLRRTQRQVWGDAPSLHWGVQEIDGAHTAAVCAETFRLFGKYNLTEADAETLAEGSEQHATLRRMVGEAKARTAAAFVADLVDAGRQRILVGCWHHSVMDAIAETLWGKYHLTSLQIHGAIPRTTQQGRLAVFQDRTTTTPVILLAQIASAGEAICLDAADHVVMAETSWVPGQDLQFAMRGVGPTTRGLPVDILALVDTLDTQIARTKVRKRQMQADLSL